ncbi:hypothetical protein fugu_006249 [Takifugu bimaculatus]|uniref:DH domain-containing protein n=1 Tax=Takifugu bimaculatus TaxID=433685 RepID=A0A4Z2B8W7_9TELE|nr:hypothetical protein fugu_006249 [Takifugu bimaculatus]
MSDSPLNNSWPSFSKLWMKRWSFKRASECKPCVEPCGSPGSHLAVQPYAPGGAGSSTSLPPASIAEDAFFSSTPEDEDTCSVVSDYDCPCAETPSSLEASRKPQSRPASSGPRTSPHPRWHPANIPPMIRTSRLWSPSFGPEQRPGYIIDGEEQEDPTGGPSLTIDLNGLLETLDARMGSEQEMQHADADLDAELDMDSFPILRQQHPGDEANGACPSAARMAAGDSKRPYSEMLATDEGSRAALISRVVQTSKQAARATGAEVGPEEHLHSSEGQSHIAKQGSSRADARDSGSVTWYEFLSNENEDEVDRTEKVEKGTKVRRTLSSLRNRMTGSFNKDKGKNREKARQRGREGGGRNRNSHRLVPGSFSSCATCSLCSKTLQQKHGLQCTKSLWDVSQVHRAPHRGGLRDSPPPVSGSRGFLLKAAHLTAIIPRHLLRSYERQAFENKEFPVRPDHGEYRSVLTSPDPLVCLPFGRTELHSERGRLRRTPGVAGTEKLIALIGSPGAEPPRCFGFVSWEPIHLSGPNPSALGAVSVLWAVVRVRLLSTQRDSPPKSGSSAPPVTAPRDQDREHEQTDPVSSQALDGHPAVPGAPGMTIGPRGTNAHPHTSSSCAAPPLSVGLSLCHHSSSGSLPGEMDETDALRSKRCNDDAVSLAPSTTESIIVEDSQFATLRVELESDAQDLEAESWSLAVDQEHVKKLSKETVKRQDVIYELMQTEMHHVRTLKIMLHVYVRELKENLQMDPGRLECLFPRLENLLELHAHFLSRLKERQRESLTSPSDRNYTINTVADILIEQFSGEIGERMKECYGDFCSHHMEAVGYYKEQKQNNKKFHNVIRKTNNLPIVRRLGVTECILLVTQRITKYPVLVERMLNNTEAGTEEHKDLTRSLSLIKEAIVQVDAQVNIHEKNSRLREIHNKMEPKALGKFKDGRVFRREDLAPGRRRLLHDWHGQLEGCFWQAQRSDNLENGHILAVLLSDVLLLLQEKDQRYVFASVDNKPSVISLQKLIVREVAHEEKAMFLICASSNEPEMYKIHTTSKEERNGWMAHIRQAAESCPHTEQRLVSEEEEARAFRFKEFQEQLSQKDAVITRALSEKLQLFADLAESVIGPEDAASRSRLLLRGDAPDLQQGETLLKGAITEVENLQNLLQSRVKEEDASSRQEDGSGSGHLPRRAVTFGGYDSSPAILNGSGKKNFSGESRNRDRSQRASSDPQLKELCGSHTLEQTVDESCCAPARWNRGSSSFPEAEFFDRVLMLSQKLYSLQAVISQWDSHVELQRAALPGRHKGNGLLEQEKQRTLALQREELATFHKMQSQHRQEQQRWERERERHRQQVEATEARLRQREEECRRLEEQLAEERKELESQRETYQQDLERLRESTRAVEKEKERLEHQKKLKRKTIEVAPMSGSLNGELLASSGLAAIASDLPPKPLVRGSLSVAPADYPERPEVTLRREASSSSTLALKTEVPLHLFSTTNQLHKPVGVQQQIPTKLAAFSSGKGKAGKTGKASHRSDSSDQLSTPEADAQSSSSTSHPPNLHKPPVPPSPPHPQLPVQSPPPSLLYPTQGPGPNPQAHGAPPLYKINPEELSKEDVIFF